MKKRIMVVDDSRIMELQIRKLLEGTDYEVAAYCENGEDAIARYDEVQPDLVTMDIIMPGIPGLSSWHSSFSSSISSSFSSRRTSSRSKLVQGSPPRGPAGMQRGLCRDRDHH